MIKVGIPAVTEGLPDILHAQIFFEESGDGSFWLDNIHEVSDTNQRSILNCKLAAQWLARRRFKQNVRIEIQDGRSWELQLVTGLTSLPTGHPLNPQVIGSGIVGQHGVVYPISSLAEKVSASRRTSFKLLLIPRGQSWEPLGGNLQV